MATSERELHEKEAEVQRLNAEILKERNTIKTSDAEIHQKQTEIEKIKAQKLEAERLVVKNENTLRKSETELAQLKKESEKHHHELSQFQQEYARAQKQTPHK